MKLLLEFTEFNNMRLGSGDSVPQSTHVDNPSISMDGFSKFDANLRNSLNRLNQMFMNINKTNTAYNLRSGEVISINDLKNIKILRIFPKDDIFLNVYFTFELNVDNGDKNTEYYGYINKINGTDPQVNSEIFRDINIQGGQEWVIRVKGNLVKVIKNWMSPPKGEYTALKDIDVFNENTGELFLIKSESKIKLIRVIDNNSILINFNDVDYVLRGKNFFYFNYFFEIIETFEEEEES
tara:strand:- start:86033 stop:86746 length:714 start_codon:yes stop_codon:yes gene_type:complete